MTVQTNMNNGDEKSDFTMRKIEKLYPQNIHL